MKALKRITYLIILLFLAVPTQAKEEIVGWQLSTDNGLPSNDIRYIDQDKTGFLTFVSRHAAYRYDGYSFLKLPPKDYAAYQKILKTSRKNADKSINDNLGNKVYFLPDGTMLYKDKLTGGEIRLKILQPEGKRKNNDLKCRVVTDRRGLIWVSVNGDGLFVYNRRTKELRHLTAADAKPVIQSDYIIYMTSDRDGNIWVSQEYMGVVCLKVTERQYDIVQPGGGTKDLRGREARMLQRIDRDHILIGDNNGRLFVADGNLNNVRVMRTGEDILSAITGYDGQLWLGTRENGLIVGNRHYLSKRIDCMLRDNRGRIWLCGLKSGLFLASQDKGGLSFKSFFTGKDHEVRCMVPDGKGNLWVGTSTGVIVFNPDDFLRNPKHYKFIKCNLLRSMLADSRHRIWIGTVDDGVFVTDGADKPLRSISSQNMLKDNTIQSLSEDSHGNICIGTEVGCLFYNPQTDKGNLLYFTDNRLRNFFEATAAVMLNDGRMAFGTLDGIVVASASFSTMTNTNASLTFTNMLINGVSILDMGGKSPVEGSLATCSGVTLEHNQNSITVSFSTFHFGGNSAMAYSYMLEGIDHGWSNPSPLNFASYPNLPPGHYKLKVRFRMENGEWSGNIKTLDITVLPPLWARWWAIMLYVAFAAIIGYYVWRNMKRTYQLRKTIAVEKQLTEYKLRFFTNISHEFRTPLTIIQGAMEKMRSAKELPGGLKQPLSNMQHSVDRMLRLVNQLLEFRKMQNGKLSLALQEDNIVTFVYNIFVDFHAAAENRSINYQFLPAKKDITVFFDHSHMDKIVYNLLSNAFKYTPRKGSISLLIGVEDGKVVLRVKDTGIGISKKQQSVLFERYETGHVSADSIGIGLNLTKELVRVHHGVIRYDENPGGGSIFTVSIPATADGYKPEDFLNAKNELESKKADDREGFEEVYKEMAMEPINDKKVLIAEDDDDIRMMLEHELSRLFQIVSASDGRQAWDLLQKNDVALVISDVMMPQMNGYQLVRRMRDDDRLKTVPVILLTALSSDEKEEKGLKAGADAYISKPFSMKVLTAQAVTLIRQHDRMKAAMAGATTEPAKKENTRLIVEEKDKRFVDMLDMTLENHIGDPNLTIDSLAEQFGYGRTVFFRKVKALTGMTPNDYIRKKRMSHALELLKTENITIAEAGYRVGMENTTYFSRLFKKEFGFLPSELKTRPMSPPSLPQGEDV